MLLSTFCGEVPKDEVNRYEKTAGKKIPVPRPKIVKEYNRHMGGVDLTDSFIGRHKIRIRSKKWYFRIFYHLLDVTMVNAWVLYRKVCQERNEKKMLTLGDFRAEVAETLCMIGTRSANKRGRPSSLEKELSAKRRKKSASVLPPEPVRNDQVGHWPLIVENRNRCKVPRCKGFSYITCEKCKVNLCLNKKNNCFKVFHNY